MTDTAYDYDKLNEEAIRKAYMEAGACKRRLEDSGRCTDEELRELRDLVWQLRAAYMTALTEALIRNDGEVGHIRDAVGDAAAAIRDAKADLDKVRDTLAKIEKAAGLAMRLLSRAAG